MHIDSISCSFWAGLQAQSPAIEPIPPSGEDLARWSSQEEEHAHRHHLQVRHRDVGVVAVDLGEDAVDERGVADR